MGIWQGVDIMTDDELKSLVESIAESSHRFAVGAELFAETANRFLDTIGKSQEQAAKMIAAQLRRSKEIREMLQQGATPIKDEIEGAKLKTRDGRIVTIPPNRG